jgi:hypothetical protein
VVRLAFGRDERWLAPRPGAAGLKLAWLLLSQTSMASPATTYTCGANADAIASADATVEPVVA